MNPGDKIRVIVPNPFNSPFDLFVEDWILWARSLHYTIALLDQQDLMHWQGVPCSGWKITTNIKTIGAVCPWVPVGWIQPYPMSGSLGAKAVAALKYSLSPQDLEGLPSRVEAPKMGYCVSCSGVGKHRLMCPVDKKKA